MERPQDTKEEPKKKIKITIFEALTLFISILALVNSQWPIKDTITPFKVEVVTPQYVYLDHLPTAPFLSIYVPIEIKNISARDGVIRNVLVSISPIDSPDDQELTYSEVSLVTQNYLLRYPVERPYFTSNESIFPVPLKKTDSTTLVLAISYPFYNYQQDTTFTGGILDLKIAFLLNNSEKLDYQYTPIRFQITQLMMTDLLKRAYDDKELRKVTVENYTQH